jgi:hypothetical protein
MFIGLLMVIMTIGIKAKGRFASALLPVGGTTNDEFARNR